MNQLLRFTCAVMILGLSSLAWSQDQSEISYFDLLLGQLKNSPEQVAHPELGPEWENFKIGVLESLAGLLELYPTEQLYFLTRDMESYFYLAQMLTAHDPEARFRLHVLPISTVSAADQNLSYFVRQEGILPGTSAVLVDSGYEGSILNIIKSAVNPEPNKLRLHLLASSNASIPSSRTFLTALNPHAAEFNPLLSFNRVRSLFHKLPVFSSTVVGYHLSDDLWSPTIQTVLETSRDFARHRPDLVRRHVEDLRAFAANPAVQSRFIASRQRWRTAIQVFSVANPSAIQAYVHSLAPVPLVQGMLRDLFEYYKIDPVDYGFRPEFPPPFASNLAQVVARESSLDPMVSRIIAATRDELVELFKEKTSDTMTPALIWLAEQVDDLPLHGRILSAINEHFRHEYIEKFRQNAYPITLTPYVQAGLKNYAEYIEHLAQKQNLALLLRIFQSYQRLVSVRERSGYMVGTMDKSDLVSDSLSIKMYSLIERLFYLIAQEQYSAGQTYLEFILDGIEDSRIRMDNFVVLIKKLTHKSLRPWAIPVTPQGDIEPSFARAELLEAFKTIYDRHRPRVVARKTKLELCAKWLARIIR